MYQKNAGCVLGWATFLEKWFWSYCRHKFHHGKNLSEKTDRYVLIIRFWHPGLSKTVVCSNFLFDAIEDPTKEGIINANRLADNREINLNLKQQVQRVKRRKKKKKGLGMLNKGID